MFFLPLLIPIALLIIPTRFVLSTRSSYARVKLLESDKESMATRLIALWAELEKEIEDAVEDVAEESISLAIGGSSNPYATSGEVTWSTPTLNPNSGSDSSPPSSAAATKSQPLLTPAQFRMIANLNSLPNLTKHIAYIDGVRNSHSIIICRSIETMTLHSKGVGVMRAWADGMRL